LRNVVSERLVYVAVLKELVDNALDAQPTSVSVTLNTTKRPAIIVTVANNGKEFSKDAVTRIFSGYEYFASDKFWKLPTRGTLGNALKIVSGASVALAERAQQSRPQILLTIRSPDGSHEITAPHDLENPQPGINFIEERKTDRTEVTITLPLSEDYSERSFEDPSGYYRDTLMPAYFLFNPGVDFTAVSQDEIMPSSPYHNWSRRLMSTGTFYTYTGHSSIHWYSQDEFKRLVRNLASSMSTYGPIKIYDFLAHFKDFHSFEARRSLLQSVRLKKYSFAQIAKDEVLVEKLCKAMKDRTEPPQPEVLGYIGRDAMHDALKEIFGESGVSSFHYHRLQKVVKADSYEVPYVIEVALATLTGSNLYQFYGINNSPFLLEYPSDPLVDPFKGVRWVWKTKKGTEGEAFSLCDFLERFEIGKGEGVAIIVHIISPNLMVEDYAKSKYDFSVTGSDIAQALYEVCRFYPKERIAEIGGASRAVEYLRKELERRQTILKAKGSVPPEEWTTQQALFYKIRNQLGGHIGIRRDSFVQAILRDCITMGGGDRTYREKLGIKAGVRAQVFHRGREDAVSFDSIERLSDKGSDLIIIEKEGVSEILEPYARQHGVAILNTRGFAAEYAKQVMKIAEQKGGNVFILTDWDASGLTMTHNFPNVTRVGVDEALIKEAGNFAKLHLTRKDVEEEYKPDEKHYKGLTPEEKKQVAETRVEIDAIMAAVGPAALWKAIELIMTRKAPLRDLSRSIEPKIYLPESISEPLKRIESYTHRVGKSIIEPKMRAFKKWRKGLIDIEEIEETIEQDVTKELSNQEILRRLATLLKKAAVMLPHSE